jgi:predicted ArsR family transcriptional regulator
MWSALNENPTREKILLFLKKRGPMSIDDLSGELHITSMGIRQHLLSLERKGLIEYITKRQGIGRPAFLYKLTVKADDIFPKGYDKFVIDLFKDIEKNEGPSKIDEIFKWRKNRLLKDTKDVFSDKKTIKDRLIGLKDLLESEGYFAELSDSNNHYSLKIFNCPIYRIAAEYKDACRYDLQLFRELLGKELNREECIIEGNTSCTYTYPKNLKN